MTSLSELSQPLTGTSKGKSFNTSAENSFKSIKFPSLKVIGWKLTKSRRILQMFVWWRVLKNFAALFVVQLLFALLRFLSSSEGPLSSLVDDNSLTALYNKLKNATVVRSTSPWLEQSYIYINKSKNYHLADKYSYLVLDWVQPRFCYFLYC